MKNFILLVALVFTSVAFGQKNIGSNEVNIGKGSGTVTLKMHNGSNHALRSTPGGKLEFSHDGTKFQPMGSGSESGGIGENIFTGDDSPGAENGIAGWTNTGGTLEIITTTTHPGEIISGEASFRFTPVGQNNQFSSIVKSFDLKKYHSISCEAGIEYYGGDENLELHVVDGEGTILNRDVSGNRKIPKREHAKGRFSVSFFCPKKSDIQATPAKGNLQIIVKNSGVGISPSITVDKFYWGDDRSLGTSRLDNTFDAQVNPSTNSVIKGDFLDSFSCSGGKVTFYYSGLGLTQVPNVDYEDTVYSQEFPNGSGDISTTQASFILSGASGASANCSSTILGFFTLTKMGADRDKVVKTSKAIPTFRDTENRFDAKITFTVNGSITIDNDPYNMLSGCSTASKYGVCNIVDTSSVWTCSAESAAHESLEATGLMYNSGTTVRVYPKLFGSGTVPTHPVSIKLDCKRLTNIKKIQARNISLFGIAVNSYAEKSQHQIRVESCLLGATGTLNGVSCNTWLDSTNNPANGLLGLSVIPGIFSQPPHCVASYNEDGFGNISSNVFVADSTTIRVRTRLGGSNNANNASTYVICLGVK